MERAGTEGTAVEEMTDSEAVAEKERGGASWARLSSLSWLRPNPLKCDADMTRPPMLRRKVEGG